jgi:Tfp pilus assembly protein PilO
VASISLRDPRLLRFLLGLVLLAALVYVYFNYVAKGTRDAIATAEDTLQMKQMELSQLRAQTSDDMAVMAQQIEMYTQELENLDRFLPRSYSQDEVLDLLTTKASNSGIQVLSLNPLPPSLDGQYAVYSWQVHLTGRYHRLGVFFDQLTQELMMTSIRDLNIQQLKAAEGKFDNIEATFTFSAFTQPSGG